MVATATETSPPMNKPGGLVPTAKRVMAAMKEHNTPVAAGGVAFFALLSLVPTLVALISIYGLAFDPDDIAEQIEQRASNLPSRTRLTSSRSRGPKSTSGFPATCLWCASGRAPTPGAASSST